MERSKVWEAAQKHKDGYNCCQAVVCTYCERLGMDEKTAFRAAELMDWALQECSRPAAVSAA